MQLCYLVEIVQSFVQVGVHTSRRFVGDFDGVLQDTVGDDVSLGCSRRLSTKKHPEVLVALLCMLLHEFFQSFEPSSHQMDVLKKEQTWTELKNEKCCTSETHVRTRRSEMTYLKRSVKQEAAKTWALTGTAYFFFFSFASHFQTIIHNRLLIVFLNVIPYFTTLLFQNWFTWLLHFSHYSRCGRTENPKWQMYHTLFYI